MVSPTYCSWHCIIINFIFIGFGYFHANTDNLNFEWFIRCCGDDRNMAYNAARPLLRFVIKIVYNRPDSANDLIHDNHENCVFSSSELEVKYPLILKIKEKALAQCGLAWWSLPIVMNGLRRLHHGILCHR